MTNTFTVRSIAQKALFDHEIKDQLSDGVWENTRPLNHSRPWQAAAVVVAKEGEPVGRSWSGGRDAYDLTSKTLLECVGARMITIVKIVMTFGEDLYGTISRLYGINGEWVGPPTDAGEYEDRLRASIARILPTQDILEQVRQLVDWQRYSRKDLLADLRDLKTTMRVVLK